jgi:eukaryotic-like serine/threonine-protein kinase
MSDPKPREETIVEGALELPTEHWAEFVLGACGGDAALERRVRALLDGHGQPAAPLDAMTPPPRGTISVALPPSEQPGDRIGPYKILQRIGEGGCGLVYMAEQEQPVRRRVALKVIKLGMDTRQVVARFEAERQALALMDHPNIARVLDGGATDTGRPYFVMELVRGIKITDYCDQNNLSTSQRLELFIPVCRAIQHAHQKGIIHRDVKPSNILVTLHDGVPVPKVIDFGIAKAIDRRLTDKTLFTQFEQFIGTPAYMSPEQAEMSGLDIDTRSDIYSLGVLLYELLTSRTPFDSKELLGAGLDAMRRLIREKDPPKPSTRLSTMLEGDLTTVARQRHAAAPKLIHIVKGDLDWIVMKALEKDRTRRYESANNFAADVQHFLADEPVIARPPSTVYRVQKLMRRNRLAFTAAGAVSAAVIMGLVVSTWMFFREREARQLAAREARHNEQVALFLEDMLKGVGPSVALGRDTTLLKEILDKTVQRVTTDLRDQPEVQADICNTIGEVYRALGQLKKAEEMHREARNLQGKRAGRVRKDVATSLSDLAFVLRDQGKLAEAESLQREALELRRKHYGNEHAEVALSLNNLALVLRSQGKLTEAEKLHREALAMQKKLLGNEHLAVATSLNNLAFALRDQGKLAEAEKCFRESLAMQKKLLGDNNPAVAITTDNLAFVLRDEGKLPEAETLVRQSLASQRKLFGEEHPSVATALNNLALVLAARGQFAEAADLHRQALALRRKLLGDPNPEVASSLDNLALVLRKQKQSAEAEKLEREALAMRKKLFGEEHMTVASSLNNLALILHDLARLAEAEAAYQESLAMQKKLLGSEHPSVATCMNNLARVLRDEGKLAEAEAQVREALVMRQKLLGEQHPSVADSRRDLEKILALQRTAGAGPR